MASLLEMRGLHVAFGGEAVVRGVDLDVAAGEALGFVGESGSGKTVTWLAALGLLPRQAKVAGSVRLHGVELSNADRRTLETVRGRRIAMIFQDPASSLNPVLRVGRQIAEAVALHSDLRGEGARREALRLMEMVGIPDRAHRYGLYPHEFSGGQCQRLMIAMALAGKPDLLVADEPTTALDATVQAQILELLLRLRAEVNMGLVFISHDLGAVSQVCDRICVMYAGRVVEQGGAHELFSEPRHPYTRGLFRAIPHLDGPDEDLATIPGTVPDPRELPSGCAFAPRCGDAGSRCAASAPSLRDVGGRAVACWNVP